MGKSARTKPTSLTDAEEAVARLAAWLRAHDITVDHDTGLRLLELVQAGLKAEPEELHEWLVERVRLWLAPELPTVPPAAPAPKRGSIGYGDRL